MSKPLVIVESPAKARSIGKFLGSGYTVKASMGHVRDLPKSKLGVHPDKGFEADWEPLDRRAKVLDDLKKRIAKTDMLYLATDPDREGEAIAWHLVDELLNGKPPKGLKVQRVVFHEITKNAIQESFQNPLSIDTHRVDAYRTRRILDRLMGYQLSPLLWKKLARGLSAGRVQSVAVRLVVEREREIRAFQPEEYWRITAHFGKKAEAFEASFMRLEGKRTNLTDEEQTMAVMERVRGGPFTVASLNQKPKTDRPRPPFITSTLQQAAAGRLGFTARRTMRVAQQLYEGVELSGETEGGLITYMRTDSFHVSAEAQKVALEVIAKRYGSRYAPERPNAYRSKKGAQEAHEAIRPTDPKLHPDMLKGRLPPEQWKMYDLIWRKFLSSQMTPASYQVTSVELLRNGAAFEAQGRVVLFDGHTRVYRRERKKDDDQGLPALQEGQELVPTAIDPTQHFTTPPRRYTEASLVRALEKHGIGRPSTYAAVLSTIVDRGYADHGEEADDDKLRQQRTLGAEARTGSEDSKAEPASSEDDPPDGPPEGRRKSRAFYATHLGEVVTDMLLPHFKDIVNTAFTARMETQLDRISEGAADWHEVVADFYEKFSRDLETAHEKMEPYWKQPVLTDVICGKVPEEGGEPCSAPMAILFNRYGTFLGCSRYPECKNTRGLSGVEKAAAEITDIACRKRNEQDEVCGLPMERKVNRWGGEFLACTGFKEGKCDGTVSVSKSGDPLWPVDTSVACPTCGGKLVVKRSRRGKFLACPRYPKCRGTLSLPKCTHKSRTGKACGRPMTEPGPRGTMACKTHGDVHKKPPVPKPSAK